VVSLSAQPESFGRTVLEALSLGVPVVGYDYGGVGEILRMVYPHGCAPLANASALAEIVAALLENSPLVPREHPFGLSAMLEATLALYRELAARKPDGRGRRDRASRLLPLRRTRLSNIL